MVDPLPYYTTAVAENGITGQQAGWDRLLSDTEIARVLGFPEIVDYARSGCSHSVSTTHTLAATVPTHDEGDLLLFMTTGFDPPDPAYGLTLEITTGQYRMYSKVAGPSEPATFSFTHTGGQFIQVAAFAIRYSDGDVYDAQEHEGSPPPQTLTGRGLVLAFVSNYGCADIEFLQAGVTSYDHWNVGLPSGTRNFAVGLWDQLAAGAPTPADYIYARGYGGSCSAGSDDNYVFIYCRVQK